MTSERRQLYLKIGAAAAVGLFLLDAVILKPAIQGWNQQASRIATLKQKVAQGRQLRERESALRERWAGILRTNLPAEVSAAETAALKAVGRWQRESQINLNSITPQWQSRDDGFDTLEYRISATGSQAALGRFLYEMESDATVPVSLEECELATRDTRGEQLTLTARLTFLRLKEPSKNPAP